MLFDSVQFFSLFIPLYLVYLILPHTGQNALLLITSYLLYMAFDERFIFLLFGISSLNFLCALWIDRATTDRRKKNWLIVAIIGNLGILGFFKYFNFFIDNALTLITALGLSANLPTLNIILPLGLSFYTFQSLSYTIDVYRGEIRATDAFADVALFIAFFPQLMAGPIETGKHLLPQVQAKRVIKYSDISLGAYLIFWGLFQKVVVADVLWPIAISVGLDPDNNNALQQLLAIFGVVMAVYCDFDGYSNIARGLGRLMGFDISVNFRFPFFARNIAEFWRNWHITLTQWMINYVYFPLGGSREGALKNARNILVVFILVGLWHGASWTFVLWGLIHGLLLIFYRLLIPLLSRIAPKSGYASKLWLCASIITTVLVWCIAGVPFCSQDMNQALAIYHRLLTWSDIDFAAVIKSDLFYWIALYSSMPLIVQWLQFRKQDVLAVYKGNIFVRAIFYLIWFYFILISSEAQATRGYLYFKF